jgi:hypothetical protein
MDELGPVDYAIIAFPGSRFNGRIAPALAELVESGTIRIVDVAFVRKEDDGTVSGFELDEFDPEVRDGFERAGVAHEDLLNDDDVLAAGEELDPGSSAAVIVWENLWARRIADAVRDAHGELLDFGRVPRDIVVAARGWVAPATEAVR